LLGLATQKYNTKEYYDSKLFTDIYTRRQLKAASQVSDVAILWSTLGSLQLLKSRVISFNMPKLILGSYIWSWKNLPNIKTTLSSMATYAAANFSHGLILMTNEQRELAKKILPPSIPVIKFTFGIDTRFYQLPSQLDDIPTKYRTAYKERLLDRPYIIVAGHQQRYDFDLLQILKMYKHINLVRTYKKLTPSISRFQEEVRAQGLEARCFFFENVNYRFLRFLFQNAIVYLGLVDSTWQPAGWTATCEAIACGTPVILYEGLVSRELQSLGAGEFLKPIPRGNIDALREILDRFLIQRKKDLHLARASMDFAANHLNCEITGQNFAKQLELIAST
jgi:glycosyltransferase involved in cell wall biosynthesis